MQHDDTPQPLPTTTPTVPTTPPPLPPGDGATPVPPVETPVPPVPMPAPLGPAVPTAEAVAGRSRRRQAGGLAAALVVGLTVGGAGTAVALDVVTGSTATVQGTAVATATDDGTTADGATDGLVPSIGGDATDGSAGGSTDGSTGGSTDGSVVVPGLPGASRGRGVPSDGLGTTTQTTTAPTAAQTTGVVTIVSTLGYSGGRSAGTGMVLSSDGLVLTNNHVVEGSTSVEVTVESTGETYTATVVGTDAAHDVAVLQLEGASGLATVALDDDGGVAPGDTVTAVGNAEGTGDLVAAEGTVTATERTITTSGDGVTAGETLDGLVEFEAAVVSGDSGGPVLDAEGEVVGITTAASSGAPTTVAYAIDVVDALAIVRQIEEGDASGSVTIGLPAFLGVQVATDGTATGPAGGGATVAGVVEGAPAAAAGLAAGDTITSVGGVAVSSAQELTDALAGFAPGDEVEVVWTQATTGASQAATITLAEGPAA
ncbi:S1C family serine protease [Cellulomonas endophytica]|uniref:S1C family serine protease n=1 Tax=Cellulomonas endophytica TaxID=2494735 RepID=UPI0010124A92|nr:trypsin-like peptidase domain-containing protein [Cellulomonas endophytica]